MEAAGVEPEKGRNDGLSKDGRNLSTSGQNLTQVGQGQEVTKGRSSISRTDEVAGCIDPGHKSSTTGAQRDHGAGRGTDPDDKLATVLLAWPGLPESVQEAILVIVRAVGSDKEGDS